MKDYEDDLRPGIIFLFWIPLALTWVMMGLEGPIVASVIARLQEAKLNLAAYGVALSVAFISEGPIIMLVSTATALVRNYSSYRKLLRFALLLNGLITVLLAILMIPGVFFFLADDVVGLPEEVSRLCLLVDTPVSALAGCDRDAALLPGYPDPPQSHTLCDLRDDHSSRFYDRGGPCFGLVGEPSWGMCGFSVPFRGCRLRGGCKPYHGSRRPDATKSRSGRRKSGLPDLQGDRFFLSSPRLDFAAVLERSFDRDLLRGKKPNGY